MLYDPKWEVETKADPFDVNTLIAWLEKQPADKLYCFLDNGHCLFGQYFTHHGFKNINVGGFGFYHDPIKGGEPVHETFPDEFGDIASVMPHTFGAALDRARALARSL